MKKIIKQAEVSKAEATNNITVKLNVLKSWAANGIPFRMHSDGSVLIDDRDRKQLDFYPCSLRQFKAWDGSQNCSSVRNILPSFTATGNDTLAKRPDMEEQVSRIISALKARATEQETHTHSSIIQKLKSELRISNLTIKARNAEVRNQQRLLREIESTKMQLEKKFNGDAEEFERLYKSMNEEIEYLKSENKSLIQQIRKLRPIRGATHE